MKIMIIAGEPSGDLHGSRLAKALKEKRPDVRLCGMGGPQMQEAGVKLLFDPTKLSTIGFVEALKNFKVLRKVMLKLADFIRQNKPNAIVFIDYPGFNMRLARMVKDEGVPMIYYFSPSAWAWGKSRAEKVAQTITKVASVFPFEAEVYQEAGADVTFVGHPLLDIVKPSMSPEEAREYFQLPPGAPVVSLLPGSRRQEVDLLLPEMLKAAELIKARVPEVRFLLPRAGSIDQKIIAGCLAKAAVQVKVVEGKTYDAINISQAAIAASGTVTLEAACLGTPMVIIYKLATSTYLLGKMLVKIPRVGLPNIILHRMAVPEYIQNDVKPEIIASDITRMLTDQAYSQKIKDDLAEVVRRLGRPGAVGRTAELVLALAENQRLRKQM
ncbi:MAG: lipid-A-disaccharide synthase [Firmicutes bacterium]|nr:lipid-A-disaccharide synthase [Bacillota bacterium]